MVKIVSMIAITKKYVGISAIKASAEVKKLLQTVSNPRRAVESVWPIPICTPTPVASTKSESSIAKWRHIWRHNGITVNMVPQI